MTRSFKIALAMTIVALGWVLSGTLSSSNTPTEQANKTEPANHFKVQVKQSLAQQVAREIVLQGEVDALRSVEIRAETHGNIQALGKDKGQQLSEGELIARIAPNERPARLEKARATLMLREADLKAGLRLRERNLLSDLQHQQNQAAVVAARADVTAIEIELAQTQIRAPFSGMLSARHVEVGDHVSVGDPIATLVDDQAALIKAQVPQHAIGDLALGQVVSATLLDGTEVTGTITYIASQADPATRTFAMEARTADHGGVRHFGQSARVRIALGETQAHLLSASALDLDTEGQLQVKTVDSSGIVQVHPVALLRNESEGVWLTGLPPAMQVITVGQGFVRAGEQVSIATADDGEEAQ